MARLNRDTAWRSLRELFDALPKDATVEVVKTGAPPPGTALSVKVQVAVANDRHEPPSNEGGQDEETDHAEL